MMVKHVELEMTRVAYNDMTEDRSNDKRLSDLSKLYTDKIIPWISKSGKSKSKNEAIEEYYHAVMASRGKAKKKK